MVRRGWDSGLDFEEAYRRMLGHMLSSGSPYDVVLLIQLRNGSRVGEAVEATMRFCASGQDLVLVRIEKHKDNDLRLMVLPEELRSGEGRQLLSEACAALSALRSPKAAVKVYCRRTYGFNTHSLRYAFVSYLLKRGVSPSIVAKITGHRSLDHILHYTEMKTAEDILSSLK
jgi:Phage integrase family.